MSSRPPAAPPVIPGFNHLRHLGSGGFADVYLYEEKLLGRKVAVKVLLAGDLMADALENFTNEANLMAQLSNHPSIVSVYQAGVSDDGRPFIVMEYCSRPNLQVRYRSGRFTEAETLRIGVQIAGAVETAHRAGILHRDIKPANILVTEYGRPALTDFGIAATTASGAQAGLSVPWAPPESFVPGTVGDERSDVYSLAATLYTLLAGRTPFEIPGASNTSVDVMGRIQTGTLPSIGRQDVSPAFGRVLATAMSRDPNARPGSAMEFARALQRLQVELGMQPTTVDVVEEAPEAIEHEEDEGRTRIRSVVSIAAQAPEITSGAPTRTTAPTLPLPQPGVTRPEFAPAAVSVPGAPPVADTQLRAPRPEPLEVLEAEPRIGARSRPRGLLIGVGALVLVAAAVIASVALFGGRELASGAAEPTISSEPVDAAPTMPAVPQVQSLNGTISGSKATFTWANPDPQDGDTYLWRSVEPGVKHTFATIEETRVVVPAAEGSTCIEVVLRRANGRSAPEPAAGCAK